MKVLSLYSDLKAIGALIAFFIIGLLSSGMAKAVDIEREPIRYSQQRRDNPIELLQKKINDGSVEFHNEKGLGRLKSLLEHLQISPTSQTLVFSKTSLQRNRISPRSPRAIYFNDEVYIGFCRGGEVLEVSTADIEVGTAFYSLEQASDSKLEFVRQTDNCLICHGSSSNNGIPGHVVRSLFVDPTGAPLFAMGSYRIDQTTEMEKRFGGWYITGNTGSQHHYGNLILKEKSSSNRDVEIDPTNLNQTSLEDYADLSRYLSNGSDIVANMLLVHQTHVHNLIAQLNIETRTALYDEKALNDQLNPGDPKRWDSTTRRIQSNAKALVRAIFFSEEADLIDPVRGDSAFSDYFVKLGPADDLGRSLRQLRLDGRMMEYPCSYLVYSRSFQQLPEEALDEVYHQMHEVLDGNSTDKAYTHLTAEDRNAIRSILEKTLPGWESE